MFAWLKAGWHVALAYVISFFVMLAVIGWHPQPKHKSGEAAPPASASSYASRPSFLPSTAPEGRTLS